MVAPVHPHARGEYVLVTRRQRAGAGSPPRTWGIHEVLDFASPGARFTPTHVGNTGHGDAARAQHAVHPHARGEYSTASASASAGFGSPPRTWGIRARAVLGPGGARFTPTHVGNTPASRAAAAAAAVHPHARGEYGYRICDGCGRHGSPPRTWGIRLTPAVPPPSCRFTPTHVGNTPRRHRAGEGRPVHPHARGEYIRPPCAAAAA